MSAIAVSQTSERLKEHILLAMDTASPEAIIDKIVDLVKEGRVKEISDVRDETDLSGLRLALDLKKGYDPDASVSSVRFKMYSRLICRSFISATYSACASSIPKPTIRLGTTSLSSSVSRIS